MELKWRHLVVVFTATQDSMRECFLSAVPQIRMYSNKQWFISLAKYPQNFRLLALGSNHHDEDISWGKHWVLYSYTISMVASR